MGLFLILGLIFLISPMLGIAFTFVSLSLHHESKNKSLISFFYIGLFLGIINTLKVPVSDLENYFSMYTYGHDLGFLPYVLSFGKEPFFMLFNYIIYELTSGSFNFYLAIFTILCYMLIFQSIWIVHNRIRLSRYTFIMAICVASFFPNIFLLSAHLMRQFMAASIILFVLVNFGFNKKRGYILFIIAILTHSTALVFSFLYLPFLKQKISSSKIVIYAIIMLLIGSAIAAFSSTFLDLFEDIPVLSYVFYRLNGTVVQWETENISILSFLLQFFVLLSFYKATNLARFQLNNLIQILFITSLFLFMFVAVNYSNTEIALRFSFYLYFLFPVAVYFLPSLSFKNTNIKNEKFLSCIIFIIFPSWFFYKLNYGEWEYNNLFSLIFYYE
tara:strand:- start:3879 stop:5039 length:1161 start_codon:yes stop_codon:yes gene_type:complete